MIARCRATAYDAARHADVAIIHAAHYMSPPLPSYCDAATLLLLLNLPAADAFCHAATPFFAAAIDDASAGYAILTPLMLMLASPDSPYAAMMPPPIPPPRLSAIR